MKRQECENCKFYEAQYDTCEACDCHVEGVLKVFKVEFSYRPASPDSSIVIAENKEQVAKMIKEKLDDIDPDDGQVYEEVVEVQYYRDLITKDGYTQTFIVNEVQTEVEDIVYTGRTCC